jgi:hypothetical protein
VKARIDFIEKEINGAPQEEAKEPPSKIIEPENKIGPQIQVDIKRLYIGYKIISRVGEEVNAGKKQSLINSSESCYDPHQFVMSQTVDIDMAKVDQPSYKGVKDRWEDYRSAITYLQEVSGISVCYA